MIFTVTDLIPWSQQLSIVNKEITFLMASQLIEGLALCPQSYFGISLQYQGGS